jgi:hypothetical protein
MIPVSKCLHGVVLNQLIRGTTSLLHHAKVSCFLNTDAGWSIWKYPPAVGMRQRGWVSCLTGTVSVLCGRAAHQLQTDRHYNNWAAAEAFAAVLGKTNKHTSWPSVLKRTIQTEGRRLSAKLMVNFAGSEVSRGQRNGSLRPFISVF